MTSRLCTLLLGACLAGTAGATTPDATTLMAEVRQRNDGQDVYSDLDLVLIDEKGGTRTRKLRYFQKDFGGDEKLLLYFTDPNDVKGVGFQTFTYDEKVGKIDDQWIYLPAFRQVRRIAATDKRGSFMGSEFAYIDLEKVRVTDYTQKITGEESILGRACWVVERTPSSDEVVARTGYYRTVVWVDKESDVVLKQSYYDAKGVEFKVMTVARLEKVQDIWTVMQSDMHDRVSDKKSSLVFSNVRYNVGLADKLFAQSILKTGVSDADVPQAR
ncbi:outer membrane lipoprotein-sorting protein [Tahibacter amnicola]|uniref:Outer membrane lipoprotein-sorting protein n=1 Tax=Tahibacter amnicola TaxID=2976241 RepID=A0ABY6BJ35_9GAMM|nr:outer membrane lipoprotein-sorting protein [Tahibacter amnicola]UXI69110.1 outer membrane lipoprotein-sorting protein [Tahibacter amnicola]